MDKMYDVLYFNKDTLIFGKLLWFKGKKRFWSMLL